MVVRATPAPGPGRGIAGGGQLQRQEWPDGFPAKQLHEVGDQQASFRSWQVAGGGQFRPGKAGQLLKGAVGDGDHRDNRRGGDPDG